MRRARIKWTVAVVASLALHASAAVLLARSEDVRIAGGGAVEVALLGNAFESRVAAGEVSERVAPAETASADESLEPVETPSYTEPVPAAEQLETQPARQVQPIVPDQEASSASVQETPPSPEAEVTPTSRSTADAAIVSLDAEETPSRATVTRASPVEADPAETAETEVVRGEELSEVAAELAALEDVPVPEARPEPPRVERRAAQAQRQNRTQKTAAAGSGGQNQADTSRGTNQGSASGRSASDNVASQSAARQAGNAAVSNYPGKIVSRLRRALRYPREAQRQRIRGEVHVGFVVSGNGQVGSVRVVRSSGTDVLDRAAMETVRRAAPFPPIPEGAGRSSWPFTVPLAFTR